MVNFDFKNNNEFILPLRKKNSRILNHTLIPAVVSQFNLILNKSCQRKKKIH